MAETVLDVLDHLLAHPHSLQQPFCQLAVGDLVAGPDVVDLTEGPLPHHQVDTCAVVGHIAPVTHVQPVSIERYPATLEQVGHEERDHLLGVLVGPEVVG